jgi:hypothetical protein
LLLTVVMISHDDDEHTQYYADSITTYSDLHFLCLMKLWSIAVPSPEFRRHKLRGNWRRPEARRTALSARAMPRSSRPVTAAPRPMGTSSPRLAAIWSILLSPPDEGRLP